ncbi:MAG: 30S ribosomal protein S8 [Planctomycetota bacterium]|jgi:small subunit ribosomal protein S8|nr:MAG: 30S ribosomal protein S8 [Planctomycetota bacterium]
MMTDPIADMLVRIRNAVMIERLSVDVPHSNQKEALAAALQREGFIWDFEVADNVERPGKTLKVNLKYGPNGEKVIQKIRRVSKPGLRTYNGVAQIQPVLNGLGVTIMTTSKGVLSSREAKAQNVGGEVLCEVW